MFRRPERSFSGQPIPQAAQWVDFKIVK